jgi:hypothetical protein
VSDLSPSLASEVSPPLDLGVLQQFLQFIGSKRQAENFVYAPRETLCHYTDLGGLQGIVASDDLWLTNCRFSNDDSEMAHGYSIARAAVDDQLSSCASSVDREYLGLLKAQLNPATPDDVYICCFCEENNRLSQWRGYGANGAGVGIEINGKEFAAITGGDMPLGLMRLWKVYYEEHEQRELVAEAIAFGREVNDPREQARRAAHAIKFFIPTFKDVDFHEEGEWRLIFTPGANCHVRPEFRVARQMLVPYYSVRALLRAIGPHMMSKLPIRHVLIGPNPRAQITKESVKMLLSRCDYPHVTVEASRTSYRA